MAINPAYTTQGARPLPVAFGYVNGAGDQIIPYVDVNGNQYAVCIGFDGETDGPEQFLSAAGTQHLLSLQSIPPDGGPYVGLSGLSYTHFHLGRWAPIGLANAAYSVGPDQGFDQYFNVIPSLTPPQTFSNMTYWFVQVPPIPGFIKRGGVKPLTLSPWGVFRGARCRYFDASGNVIGYGFTTNPTWQMVEIILRYKIKRQQPQIAGLTAAEKACFNWPKIVAHAAYNAGVLANGQNRYNSNFLFAAEGTMASMLEPILRACQSCIDDQDGKIAFRHIAPVDSSFTLTANHIFPGSFQASNKDLSNARNQFIPNFRDLDVHALIAVISASINNAGATEGVNNIPGGTYAMYFNTGGQAPFDQGDTLVYGGGTNPALNGDWAVGFTPDPTFVGPQIWCVPITGHPFTAPVSGTGGYIGTEDSRFSPQSPKTVQHRRHQASCGQIAPGITPLPTIRPVKYDLGNMTYDQANRLMKFMRDSTLGPDVDPWKPPVIGTVRVRLEAVDADGDTFIRMRPRYQRFTVDDTVSPEFAGDYWITDMTPIPPSKKEPLGAIDVTFQSYIEAAFTDTSDPPDDNSITIPTAALQYTNSSLEMSNVAWPLSMVVNQTVAGDGSITITITDLVMQLLGAVGFNSYPGAVWTELTNGSIYTLYVDDPGGGAAPTFGAALGSSLPPGSPAYRYPVLTVNATGYNPLGSSGPGGSGGVEPTPAYPPEEG